MKVSLVTCLSADWQQGREPDPYIPLGLLTIGAALEQIGCQVEIIDQTLAIKNGHFTNDRHFYHEAARLIADSVPDIVGFTTMCNSYPQTVELARHFRQIDRHTPVIFGGPQATAVDVETMATFPWVDWIVRGEADETLPWLITCLRDGRDWLNLPGLTWREGSGVRRTIDAPLVDLESLPVPAYHLYPLDGFLLIPIDAGRGCPFECTFCSTNLFFKRRYRMKTAQRLVAEMCLLQERYNHSDFDLVHDMFTVDQRRIREICQAIREADLGLRFGCSARADCVNPDLLAEMAAAGCMGMFFGLESGSANMQVKMKKKLHPATVRPVIQAALDNQIDVTTSFIVAFPEETENEMYETLDMLLDFVCMGVEKVQCHLLAPLVGSPLYHQYRDQLLYDGHCSDISTYLLTQEEVALVENHPHIFCSFYHFPTFFMDRTRAKAVSAAVYAFPHLLLALRTLESEFSGVIERWIAWKSRYVNSSAQDYYNNQFGLDFCRYLRSEIASGRWPHAPYLPDLVEYTAIKYAMVKHRVRQKSIMRRFTYDVREIVRRLLARSSLDNLEPASVALMFTQTEKEIKVIRLTPALQRLVGIHAPEQPGDVGRSRLQTGAGESAIAAANGDSLNRVVAPPASTLTLPAAGD
jgi:radical SAM superfamily enzyme YgiQ (UPF0313 family)